MNPRHLRVIWRQIKRRRRDRLVAAGLTTYGTPRRYRTWTDLKHLTKHRRNLERQRRRRQEFQAQGLTVLGRQRKDRIPLTPQELAYQEFRATIKMPELNFTTGRCE